MRHVIITGMMMMQRFPQMRLGMLWCARGPLGDAVLVRLNPFQHVLTPCGAPAATPRPCVIVPFITFYPFIYVYAIANNAFGSSAGSDDFKGQNKLLIR